MSRESKSSSGQGIALSLVMVVGIVDMVKDVMLQ